MSTPKPVNVQVRRFFGTVLPATLPLVCGFLLAFGILVYRLTHPGAVAELVNPSSFLLPSADATWSLRDGVQLKGWWIPGGKDEPAVILVPGILMNRSDALSLAASLHRKNFGVLTFDLRGRGAVPKGSCGLGLRETEDVLSAIDFVKSRANVDATRLGIWGVDVGARAALDAAARRPEVRAVAADSPYDTVGDFVRLRLAEDLGTASHLVEFACLHVLSRLHDGACGGAPGSAAVGFARGSERPVRAGSQPQGARAHDRGAFPRAWSRAKR